MIKFSPIQHNQKYCVPLLGPGLKTVGMLSLFLLSFGWNPLEPSLDYATRYWRITE